MMMQNEKDILFVRRASIYNYCLKCHSPPSNSSHYQFGRTVKIRDLKHKPIHQLAQQLNFEMSFPNVMAANFMPSPNVK